MDQPNQSYSENHLLRRGLRCYGINITYTRHIYIHGIFSWTVSKLWNVLKNKFAEFFNNILAIKKYSFYQRKSYVIIKVKNYGFNFDASKIYSVVYSGIALSNIVDVRDGFTKYSSKEKRKIISYPFHISKNNHDDRILDISLSDYDPSDKKTSFCLCWNTNGWNSEKKDGIEYFISLFKQIIIKSILYFIQIIIILII